MTPIVTLNNLPPGSYSLDGRVHLYYTNFGTSANVTAAACELVVGSGTSGTIDHVDFYLPQIAYSEGIVSLPQIVNLTGTVVLGANSPITLQCLVNTQTGSATYGTIRATQVAQITTQ